jgi:hypothetical protein
MARRAVLLGIFDRPRAALDTVRALRVGGVPPRKLGFAQRDGEILQTLGLLAEADVLEHDFAGALIGIGVPVRQARRCWTALEQGYTVVAAQPDAHQVADATSAFETYGVSWLCVFSPGAPVAKLM